MKGLDISNYQAKIDLTKGNYDFAIIKATEGATFEDKCFIKFASQLTELKKLIGCYHFARPDLHDSVTEIQEEADHFISRVKSSGLLHKALLIIDWEKEPIDRTDLLQAWILRVESKTGITPFIYINTSHYNRIKDSWPVTHCPLWIAKWPNHISYMCGDELPSQNPDDKIPWKIWQYTSVGKFPQYSGNVDLDYTNMSKEEWKYLAGVELKDKEIISNDMQWAIDNGLFAGYGNGMYGPKEPLTREQAATVLRRFAKIFEV